MVTHKDFQTAGGLNKWSFLEVTSHSKQRCQEKYDALHTAGIW